MENEHLGLSIALGLPVGIVKQKLSQGGFIQINEDENEENIGELISDEGTISDEGYFISFYDLSLQMMLDIVSLMQNKLLVE